MKKILFVVLAFSGLLLALPAFAADAIPVPSPSGTMTIQSTAAVNTGVSAWPAQTVTTNVARVGMPCPMMQSSSMGMRGQMPCGGNVMYSTFMGASRGGNEAAWLGLMFIMTVILVWVVLLLLIAVLWKHLQKHKHH